MIKTLAKRQVTACYCLYLIFKWIRTSVLLLFTPYKPQRATPGTPQLFFPHSISLVSRLLKSFQLYTDLHVLLSSAVAVGTNLWQCLEAGLTLINRDSAWLGAVTLVWAYKWHLMHFSPAVYLQTSFQRSVSIEHAAYESSLRFILGNHSSLKKMLWCAG